MKHPEYNFLSMYYWIVCKHAVNQKQCGDICILRAHISFLAEMIEFQVLKYSVLWIPHPVRTAEILFPVSLFPELFTEKFNIKQNNLKRDEIVHFCFVQIPLWNWTPEDMTRKSFSNISKFSLNFWNNAISLSPL